MRKHSDRSRVVHAWTVALVALVILHGHALAQTDPLPSWNDGAAKDAIVEFVRATTTKGRPTFVPAAERIATFDQDGTLWVEQPAYAQLVFIVDHVPEIVKARPELASAAPFKTILTDGRAALAKLSKEDLGKLLVAATTGVGVADFQAAARQWADTANHPRWKRRYTELAYLPMLELMTYLRAHGYRTYIVTGGGQDFVRVFSESIYGIPPEQVVGSAGAVAFERDRTGKPMLVKEPKLLLDDDKAGKPEGIHLVIGRQPLAAFGNSAGDREMLEYTKAGPGPRLAMLVLHDDASREYAYGPANGLPDSKVGAFTQALYDEAARSGWVVVSMKNDWKRIFAFEK